MGRASRNSSDMVYRLKCRRTDNTDLPAVTRQSRQVYAVCAARETRNDLYRIDANTEGAYHCLMIECQNCQVPLSGDYCGNCGQRNVDLERPIWSLVADVIKETFEVDGRAWLTIKTLFRYPGMLTSEFLAGRRRRYTPPLRLYLVTSISFFVFVAWLAQSGVLLDPGQDPKFDAAVQAQFLSDELPRLMFVLLPVFALLLKAVYFRRLYFDHLIFSIHLHTAGYMILALMLPLEDFANQNIGLMIAQFILLVYFLAYFVSAVRRVYGPGWLVASLKSAAVLFGYMIAVSMAIESASNILIIGD